MAVLVWRRGVRRVFGGGSGDGLGPGDGGSLVDFALINGGCWTCWRVV